MFDSLFPVLLIILFLCWGSFLNVVGYRLIQGGTLLSRSQCPHCKHVLAWYDLIPLLSYLMLQAKCRYCTQSISFLYPALELFTTIALLTGYYFIDPDYYLAFFILFSALIVTIRTDLETMLISRWVTTALIPIGILFSFTDHIPIMPLNSIMGAVVGYLSLWLIGIVFYAITKKEGIGQGDFDLMALIGSFTGLFGIWGTLLIGSILGTLIGFLYLKFTGALKRHAKLPFGPFLAIGAIIYVCFHEYLHEWFLGF